MVKKTKKSKKRCLRMPIQVPGGAGNYEKCPEGEHNAVLVDIVDLGMVHSEKYDKTSPKVTFVWQVDKTDERGLPFLIFKTYTNSMHEKASLRKDLVRWLKADFKLDAIRKDLEVMLGKGCRLEIIHNPGKEGKVFANVDGIRPLAAGDKAPKVHPDFQRKKDRPEGQGPFGKHTSKSSDPDEGPGPEESW